MTETTCACGQPTREGRSFCETCADRLSRALGDVPWLDDELETTVGKRKGVDYRRVGGGKGGKTERPSPVEWTASEARAHLRGVLVAWVRFCAEEHVRNQSPHQGIPADTLAAISRWLLWRVDGLALLDIGAEAVDEITSAVAHCHRLIDRPADRQYLGACECGAELWARRHAGTVRCRECGLVIDADAVRENLLAELDARIYTAAEIADLSTYLGLRSGREQVRNRVNQWHKRGRITSEATFDESPAFRFGIVWRLLASDDAAKVETA